MDISNSNDFQVIRSELRLHASDQKRLGKHMALAHHNANGKHIVYPTLYFICSLFHKPRLIRWFSIFMIVLYYSRSLS